MKTKRDIAFGKMWKAYVILEKKEDAFYNAMQRRRIAKKAYKKAFKQWDLIRNEKP